MSKILPGKPNSKAPIEALLKNRVFLCPQGIPGRVGALKYLFLPLGLLFLEVRRVWEDLEVYVNENHVLTDDTDNDEVFMGVGYEF